MSKTVSQAIKDSFPSLDEELIVYIEGVLEDVETLHSSKDVFDVVGDFILDGVPGCEEEEAMSVCSKLYGILKGDDTAQDDPQGSTEMKLLNAPVMIQQKLKDQGLLLAFTLYYPM
jgi:hypothetical protein